jgi:hypothetical protein
MCISLTVMQRRRVQAVPRNRRQPLIFKRKGGGFLCYLQLFGWILAAGTVAGPASAIEIVPHRAAYSFEVIDIDNQSGVTEIEGGMTFEWADACDGWAIDQRYLLRITGDDGTDIVTQSSSVSWESKDGRRMRFTSKRERDGEVTDQFSGEAELDRAGGAGAARFTQPREVQIELPSGTRFPTDMTITLMNMASRGERNFKGFVFEGGDLETAQPFTALMLARRSARHEGILTAPLGPHTVWPMFLAYYKPQGGDDIPETEISMDVQENGIVPDFTLNYGTFKLRARLARIVALPPVKC